MQSESASTRSGNLVSPQPRTSPAPAGTPTSMPVFVIRSPTSMMPQYRAPACYAYVSMAPGGVTPHGQQVLTLPGLTGGQSGQATAALSPTVHIQPTMHAVTSPVIQQQQQQQQVRANLPLARTVYQYPMSMNTFVLQPQMLVNGSTIPMVSGPARPLPSDTPDTTFTTRPTADGQAPEVAGSEQAARHNGDSSNGYDDDDDDEEHVDVDDSDVGHTAVASALPRHMQAQAFNTPEASDVGSEINPIRINDGVDNELAKQREAKVINDKCAVTMPSGETLYYCKTHELHFENRRHLEQHFLLHRTENKQVLCHLCGAIFTRADHLNRHCQTHPSQETMPCQLCDQTFERLSHLYRHWKTRHPHLSESASVTSGSSSEPVSDTPPLSPNRSSIGEWACAPATRRHASTTDEPSAKRLCMPVAQLAANVNVPQAAGLGKQHTCLQCHKSFKRLAHLQRHQLIHSGQKPFFCFNCNSSFNRQDYLRSHLKQQHDNERVPCCEICSTSVDTMTELFDHYKAVHGRAKPSFLQPRFSQDIDVKYEEEEEEEEEEDDDDTSSSVQVHNDEFETAEALLSLQQSPVVSAPPSVPVSPHPIKRE